MRNLNGGSVSEKLILRIRAEPPNGVRIGDAREAEIGLHALVHRHVRANPSRVRRISWSGRLELEPERTIELGAVQAVGWMPRQRQRELRVVDLRGVHNDVLSEAALVSLLLLDAGGKDSPEVPLAVRVLPQVNYGTLRLEMAEQNSAVEEIARIVLDANRAGATKTESSSSRISTESIVTPLKKPPLMWPM